MVHNLETPHTARRTSYIKTEVIKSASVHCLSLFFPSYFAVWSFHPEGIANAPGNLAKHVAPVSLHSATKCKSVMTASAPILSNSSNESRRPS